MARAPVKSISSSQAIYDNRIRHSTIGSLISGANDPANRTDITGLWAEDVHRDWTTDWAVGVGISQDTAVAIGLADDAIDTLFNPEIMSDDTWSWHFNRSLSGDSRIAHRDQMLKNARAACSNKIDDPTGAAMYLGYALHPDQDWVAHGDYNRKVDAPKLGLGGLEALYYWHNFGLGAVGNESTGMPDNSGLDADDSTDHGRATLVAFMGPHGGMKMLSNLDFVYWVSYHGGSERLNFTRDRTIQLLQEFQTYVGTQNGACKCRKAFLGGQ